MLVRCFLPSLFASCSLMAAPLVEVARTEVPPPAKVSEEAPPWKRALVVSDLIVPDSDRPMQERTDVRFLWDAGHLYVQARLAESTFVVATQQMHEIRAEATERDGNVFGDDSFLLILRPEGGETAYEFAINTKGVVSDAKAKADQLWQSRDPAWNANFHSDVVIEDGYWIAQLAIPWKELGVEAPKAGAKWQAIVARHAAKRKETGGWNRSRSGVHSPEEWSTLILGEGAAPALTVKEGISTLEPGKNTLALTLTHPGKEEGVLTLASKITPKQGPPVRSRQQIALQPGKETTVRHEFDLKENAGVKSFSWTVNDAATLAPIYQSPEMAAEVISSSLTLHLSAPGPWRLLVNHETVATGKGGEPEAAHRVRLRTGANLIAIASEEGSAKLRFEGDLLGKAPIRWKMRDATAKEALDVKADDARWETAPESEEGVIGNPGSATVLRHTVLLQHTRFFPTPDQAYHVAGGITQLMTFSAFGLPGRELHDWKTWFELPEGLEGVGATGYYGKTHDKPTFAFEGDGDQRYRVTASAPIRERNVNNPPILAVFDVGVRRSDEKERSKEAAKPLHYYSRANDATLSEVVQSLPIAYHGNVRGQQPQGLVFQIWASFFTAMDNAALREEILKASKKAGFNDFIHAAREEADAQQLKTTQLIVFKTWAINLEPWLKENPDARRVDRKGNTDTETMCTTVLIEKGWREVAAPLMVKWWEKLKPNTVNYDYEYPPFVGPHSCFCPRCLDHFRKQANLPEGKKLDGEIIAAEHNAAWVDFMARRVTDLFVQMKASVHELPGDIKFELYSGYHTPENATRYGLDWKYVGEKQAADRAGVGYGRPLPAIEETVKALKGIPVMFGELVTPYMLKEVNYSRTARQITKADLLRRVIDSTGGTLVYHTQNMDGRSWQSVGEISRLVAGREVLFGFPRASTLQGHSEAEVAMILHEGKGALCVLNPTRGEKSFRIALPSELADTREFYSGQTAKAGAEINITLPPGEAAVYLSETK